VQIAAREPQLMGEGAPDDWHTSTGGWRRRLHFAIGPFLYGIGRILFVAVFILLLFFLGQAMVRQRFFQGGHYNRNGTVSQ
jgi:hypothetical protein